MPKSYTIGYLTRYSLILSGVWTVAIALAIFSQIESQRQIIHDNALVQARALFERDILYRRWNARQGGVYVRPPADPKSSLPWPGRSGKDLDNTPSRKRLTLVDPSAMMRQVFELGNSLSEYRSHILSLRSLSRENIPDPWEAQALEALARGEKEVSTIVSMGGRDFLCLMRPLIMEKECLQCHADEAIPKGVVCGGISIALPLEPLMKENWRHIAFFSFPFLILWGLGLATVGLGVKKLRRQVFAIQESTHQLDEAERNLNYVTFHDRMTGLPNHILFQDRLRLALAHARRLDLRLAVAVLGLDHFKKINHIFGHETGDTLIRMAGERITGCLRPDDTVARLGEDRFVILLPCIGKGENAAKVAQKIQEALNPAFETGGQEFFLSACIGIAIFPDDGDDEKELLKNGDIALARAKDMGSNGFQLYAPTMNARAIEQLTLENSLRKALERNQFTLFYQPQVDARTERIIGAEALLRWRHPELGTVTPDRFISLTEESGMILPIGEWVLRTSCAQAVIWEKVTGHPISVGVNLSARQFQQADFVDLVERVLAETGLNPTSLELEITEGILIEDLEKAIETLTDLKVRGIRIAIDDFGIGYSSLNYLKKFPIDRIKIDRTFVWDIHKSQGDNLIVSSIAEISKRMNLHLIAEGVETDSQKEFLLANHCPCMQGYLFSRPVDAEGFLKLLVRATGMAPGDFSP